MLCGSIVIGDKWRWGSAPARDILVRVLGPSQHQAKLSGPNSRIRKRLFKLIHGPRLPAASHQPRCSKVARIGGNSWVCSPLLYNLPRWLLLPLNGRFPFPYPWVVMTPSRSTTCMA